MWSAALARCPHYIHIRAGIFFLDVVASSVYGSSRVSLKAGEQFVSEAGKMVRMSTCINNEVETVKKSGGMLGGLKRMLGGEAFFFSRYTAEADGEVVLAPTLPGNVGFQHLDGTCGWYCAGGSYLGSGPEIKTEPKWQPGRKRKSKRSTSS